LAITIIYLGIGVYVNFFVLQVFCVPVFYAACIWVAFFVAITMLPFVKKNILKWLCYFFSGTGVFICSYCILFLGGPFLLGYVLYFLFILFLGAGLLAFIPIYFLVHIRMYYKQALEIERKILIAGIIAPFVALAIYLVSFYNYSNKIHLLSTRSKNKNEFFQNIPKTYFTERYLGLHWKYHTCLEAIDDGWRPPLHDSFLNITLWLGGSRLMHSNHPYFENSTWWPRDRFDFDKNSYWPVYNEESIKYYHRVFPEMALKENCPCSYCRNGLEYLSAILDSVSHNPFYNPVFSNPQK